MIVITTPTGQIGRQILPLLLAHDEPVRVIVRDPSRLPAAICDRVEIVAGSHGDPRVLSRAFAGTEAVFWVVPTDPAAPSMAATYVDWTRPAAEAFRAHGVRRVVGISALGRGAPDAAQAGLVTASLAMDDLIGDAGVSYRALTNPSFMDNILNQVHAIREKGMFFGPINADLRLPMVATADIAGRAAELLRDREWSGRAEIPVLGPEDLSFDDLAAIISEVIGRPVRYQPIPLDAFRARLAERGMSPAIVEGYADMMAAKNRGLDKAVPRTPESRSPTSFRHWCEAVLRPAVLG